MLCKIVPFKLHVRGLFRITSSFVRPVVMQTVETKFSFCHVFEYLMSLLWKCLSSFISIKVFDVLNRYSLK